MELPNEDIKFIADETLDFGLTSPSDGPEGEDFVICPLEPSERCAAQTIDMNIWLRGTESRTREQSSQWSPLSPEKLEEVMKEANLLAAQLERCKLQEKENTTSEWRLEAVPECQPLSPIRFLHVEKTSSRNPRRETFNVKNSPVKALLPVVGPETDLALVSPKVLFPKRGSPAPCISESPIPKRIQKKSNMCSPECQLSKKSRPSNSPKVLITAKCPSSKKSPSSRSGRTTTLSLPCAIQNQASLLDLRPPLQTNRKGPLRKTEEASGQADAAENSQLSLRDSPSRGTASAQMKGKLGSRLCPQHTSPVKKSSSAREKLVPLQKANASQAKMMEGDGPQSQSSSKSHSGSCQIQTRSTATTMLASRLPVPKSIPKAASHATALGRHAVPGRPSQFKPLNLGVPGGKGSLMPVPAGKKASAFQQTIPSGTSQNSRLQLPKKATSGSSR